MYRSGMEIPKVAFSSITYSKIASGSYFIGFNLDTGGLLSKMDSTGKITILEPTELAVDKIDPRDFIISNPLSIDAGFNNSLLVALDKGYVTQYDDNFKQPLNGIYLLSSVETSLKFLEAVNQWTEYPLDNATTYDIGIAASIETYLKFEEAVETYDINLRIGNTDFADAFADLLLNTEFTTENLEQKTEVLGRILNQGIVEFSLIGANSKLDYLESFRRIEEFVEGAFIDIQWLLNNPEWSNVFPEDFNRILDKGIVVYSLPTGGIFISSVETSLKFFDEINNL
jgi:hypothetical protein